MTSIAVQGNLIGMLRCHLIQHRDMQAEGTSSLTSLLGQHLVGSPHYFSDETSFLRACKAVDALFASHQDDVHAVVICTHGDEGTGRLDMGAGNASMAPIHKLFPGRPSNLLVYMAVCWGAYTGVMKMFQHGARPFPVVVGALVNATTVEGDSLQDTVIRVLDGIGIDEDAIQTKVEEFNSSPVLDYGQPAARIARSDGTLVPKQGTAGISWGLLRDGAGEPVKGPFHIVAFERRRDVATVSHNGEEWQAKAGRLRIANGGREPTVGQQFRFQAKLCPTGAVLQIVGDATLWA